MNKELVFLVQATLDLKNGNSLSRSLSNILATQQSQHHGLCETGKSPLIFAGEGVKISATSNIEEILKSQSAQERFGGRNWEQILPSLLWCQLRHGVKRILNKTRLPSHSPDLNPMDFPALSILGREACTKSHTGINALKAFSEDAPQELKKD